MREILGSCLNWGAQLPLDLLQVDLSLVVKSEGSDLQCTRLRSDQASDKVSRTTCFTWMDLNHIINSCGNKNDWHLLCQERWEIFYLLIYYRHLYRPLHRLTVSTSAYLTRTHTSTHPPHTHTHFSVSYTGLTNSHSLISYHAGAWHYRIFLDFLNSGFKMASTIEGKAKVIACTWNDIKGQITQESYILQQRTVVSLL